ncbi:MAG TPA: hypothetical protein VKR57_11935 [Terriglobales bacterium]|nr:hypothetical protein [Terriglobales bacterium]
MTYRTHENDAAQDSFTSDAIKRAKPLKGIVFTVLAVMALASVSLAAEPPDAPSSVIPISAAVIATVPVRATRLPEAKPIDAKFIGLALISSGSTFADSYTTLFARQNWLAGKKGVCNAEVESAYLYGTHPTVGRAYAVASAKSAGSILAAYYLRKHHSKFWSLSLIANSVASLGGVTQNMIVCN